MPKFLFVLALCAALTTPSFANETPGFSLQRVAQTTINESQAIQIALRSLPGKALSAQLSDENGRKVYKVKILSNDGRVRTVNVDAENGRIL